MRVLEKKKGLKEGEMIKLCYDEAFKIMFANNDHLEILTMLLSKILKIDYNLLEGKVALEPLSVSKKQIGEKKSERDVVVSIKYDKDYKIVMEVNVKDAFYQSVMDRNLYYSFQTAGHVLKEKETYDNMPYTFLINFNTFFINRSERNIFEEFTLQDKYGMVLSEKYKVLNINIAECYNLWYDNKYQGMFEPLVEDLVLLCASMMVSLESDFKKIIKMVQIKPEIKVLMEGMVKEMNHDEKLVKEYTYWKDENERINASIISEVKNKALKEGIEQGIKNEKRSTVINMHQDNLSLELISKYTNLTVEEIKEIIDNISD